MKENKQSLISRKLENKETAPLNLQERVAKRKRESWVSKLNGWGTIGTFATFFSVLAFPALSPALLGGDILTNVAGDKVKELNDKKIEGEEAKKEKGGDRINQKSRLALVENPNPQPSQPPLKLAA